MTVLAGVSFGPCSEHAFRAESPSAHVVGRDRRGRRRPFGRDRPRGRRRAGAAARSARAYGRGAGAGLLSRLVAASVGRSRQGGDRVESGGTAAREGRARYTRHRPPTLARACVAVAGGAGHPRGDPGAGRFGREASARRRGRQWRHGQHGRDHPARCQGWRPGGGARWRREAWAPQQRACAGLLHGW